jgi:hypothetical protein
VQVVCAHCQSLDTLTSLAAVHSSVTSAAASAAPALKAALEDRWAAWLAAVERPLLISDVSEEHASRLDMCIGRFVLGDACAQQLTWRSTAPKQTLTRAQRGWVQRRGQQLGLASKVVSLDSNRDLGCVELVKPEGWRMDWQRGRNTEFAARDAAQRRTWQQQPWRTTCQHCRRELDAFGALYLWRAGDGPYCERCIDGDPDLRACGEEAWVPKCRWSASP